MRIHRNVVVAATVALIGVSGIGLTARALFFSGQETFPAVAKTATQIDLNFQASAQISEVDVKPGDHVIAGMVVAKLDDKGAELLVNSAQATLDLDNGLLAVLQAPPTSVATQALQLEVTRAQQQLDAAQKNLRDAQSQGSGTQSRNQAALDSARATLASDQQIYTQNCADPTTLDCQRQSTQITHDESAVSSAQAALNQGGQTSTEASDSAQRAVAVAQTALAIAQARLNLKSNPPTSDRIQSVQASIQKDMSALGIARQNRDRYLLTAPVSGLVVEVNGVAGDLASDLGVRNFAGPTALVPTQPGFQLYPGSSSNTSPSNAYSSFMRLADTSQWQMVAQVPEKQVLDLNATLTATVTFNALHDHTTGRFLAVIPAPITTSSGVFYNAVFQLDKPPSGLLPGMTGNVTINLK